MYILINNDTIYIKRNLKSINKKLGTSFKKEDFKNYNSKYILNIDNDDLEFKRNVHEMEKVFINKLYKKDFSNLINYGFYIVMIIMILITLTSVSGASKMLSEIITKGVLIR